MSSKPISSMISPSEGRGIETRYVGADSEGGEETDTSPLTLFIMGGGRGTQEYDRFLLNKKIEDTSAFN